MSFQIQVAKLRVKTANGLTPAGRNESGEWQPNGRSARAIVPNLTEGLIVFS